MRAVLELLKIVAGLAIVAAVGSYWGPDTFSQNPRLGTRALWERAEQCRQLWCLAAEVAIFRVIFAQKVTKGGFFAER
jgi:hypothetical protein